MDSPSSDFIKQREIHFRDHNPQANQAREASQLLMGVKGIEQLRVLTPDCLQVRYDLRQISMQMIESALAEVGFHLDNNLLAKMKRALIYYTEDTQLLNEGQHHDQASSTLDIFVNCYNQRQHGCRDERPPHLRRYS